MAAVPSIGRASLVEQTVAPAAAATEDLYERHGTKILSYCLHQLGSREEAEDAVQTTFMNAFRALGRGVVPEAEAAWLYKIAENVCLSRHRSSWRRGRIESPADLELFEHVVPAPSRQADELIGLEDALAALPEQQRRAILLREWQGLSYREVANELDVSQSAVETLIFRARRSLAQGLEQPRMPRRRLRRVLHALDLAPLLGVLKTLLAGGAAAKATAAAVAVTAAVSVAGGSTPTTATATAAAATTAASKAGSATALVPARPAARSAPSTDVPAAGGVVETRRAASAVPKKPARAPKAKVKAAARKAAPTAATPAVPAPRPQHGQSRRAAVPVRTAPPVSPGKSAAARTQHAPAPDTSKGRAVGPSDAGPSGTGPPATVPLRPAPKLAPAKPVKPDEPATPSADATPAEPPAAAPGQARADAARSK